ncbi:MAG: Gfo/Idh/MocA family oxidoreductase, partial [Planctomycetota bacterium]
MKTGIGLIGFGSRLEHVIKETMAAAKGKIEVRAVMDPVKKRVKLCRDLYGDVKEYKDYKKLVQDKNIDWVFIGSLNSQHK